MLKNVFRNCGRYLERIDVPDFPPILHQLWLEILGVPVWEHGRGRDRGRT